VSRHRKPDDNDWAWMLIACAVLAVLLVILIVLDIDNARGR
jgi:hypothetical protein